MSIINIDKREVSATNRNGRLNTTAIVANTSSSSNSSSSNGITASGLTANYLPIYNGAQLVNSTIQKTTTNGLITTDKFTSPLIYNSGESMYIGSGLIKLNNAGGLITCDGDEFKKIEFIDSEFVISPDLAANEVYHKFSTDAVYSTDSNTTLGKSSARYANLYATTINVSSGALVANLNADMLDGNHSSAFALAGHTHTGMGSVTSVGLSLPSILTVTGSPVTTTGTLTATLASQTAGTVFAAPSGANGTPLFRFLQSTDIPSLTSLYDKYTSWNITAGGATVPIESVNSAGSYRGVNFVAGNGITIGSYSSAGNTFSTAISADLGTGATQAAAGNHTHNNLPSYSIVASNAATTSTTGVDVTGLVIAVVSGVIYEYEANLMIQSSDTNGNGYGVFLSGAGSATGTFLTQLNTTVFQNYITSVNTYYTGIMVAMGTGVLVIKGIVRPTANGNFSIKHKKVTSGTATVNADSYLKLTRIS